VKKIFRGFSLVIAVFSLVFLLYGSIKLAHAQEPPHTFKIDDSDIEVVSPSVSMSEETAEAVIGVSVVTLIVGGVGFFLSANKESNESG
jgi:hypothetical protein